MRVFIALPISGALKNTIKQWRKTYKDLPVRWLEDKNLHITLVPPWEENDLPRIEAALRKHPSQIGPQTLEFTETSFGPDSKGPRLIWATGQAPYELSQLRSSIEKILKRPITKKPLLQHLTLARFRPHDFPSFPNIDLSKHIHWTDVVDSFALMESKLLPEGAEYTIIQSFRI